MSTKIKNFWIFEKRGFSIKTLLPIWILVSVLLLSSLAYADTIYPTLGGDDATYQRGTGNWNSLLDTDLVTTTSKSINTQTLYPIVEDLDNDGNLEVVILDGATLRIYQNKTLNVVAQYATSGGRTSNLLAYDINGNGNKEVIFFKNSGENLYIIGFDGTNLSITSQTTSGSITFVDGETMLGCKDVNDCVLVYTNSDGSGTGTARSIYAIGFNSTAELTTSEFQVDFHSGASIYQGNMCLPKFKHVVNDNDMFTFSYAHVSQRSSDRAGMVKRISRSGSTLSTDMTIEQASTSVFSPVSTFACTTHGFEKYITSPLVADVSSSFADDELVIGLGYDSDEFKMYSYQHDGTFIDDYPEVTQANGEIFSNVMLFNAFEDTGNVDFCVTGYATLADELNLACGSIETSGVQTREYEYAGITSIFNITDSYQYYNPLAHSVQYSEIITDGENLNELITAYGVFSLDTTGTNTLDLEYTNPKGNSVIIPVDLEQVGLEDLLVMTTTNLFYLDDGFTNTKGQITAYSINPCIDAVWKENTTVNVQIEVSDIDDDNVFAYSSLYDNSLFERNETSANASSGTTFSFFFTANETIANGLLTLEGYDVENPTNPDSIPLSFSVSSQGVEYGDCVTNVEIALVEDDGVVSPTDPQDDNIITTGIQDIDELFNFGLGSTLLYLIIMAVVAVTIWTTNTGAESRHTFGIIGIVMTIMLIIGAILGFISTGIVITLVVISLLILALFIRNMFTGQ